MARRSLRPQLNQIRAWVRQGRTDAWIAHQLEVTVQQIAAFKRENELDDGEPAAAGVDFDDEIDLRAEDDARIAAELEAAAAEEEAAAEEAAEDGDEDGDEEGDEDGDEDGDEESDEESDEDGDEEGDEDAAPRRRRGRRGGRGRRRRPTVLEGTFDHGEEGYGLWLDPAVGDDPVYAEHWAGHRPVEVVVEAEQIVIRRAGEEPEDNGD
jgi:hypothetical protein